MSEESTRPQEPRTQKNLHYRLTCEEWLSISKELKLAELRVLYYLRTLDPFGDRQLNLKVIDIAQATGLQKGTVSKALRVLANHEYIDLEMVTVQIRVKKFPVENQVSYRKPESTTENFSASQETSAHHRKLESTTENFQKPEPFQRLGSGSPHTIQTLKTDQSLSNSATATQTVEKERETNKDDPEFKDWLHRKALQLPKPPQLIEQWIAKQATVEANQRDYLKSKGRATVENVPPPPNRFQIESACIVAHDQGDRNFILFKLQQLWEAGWHDLIEDLCQLYPTWGVIATSGGIVEVEQWLT
jgi:hypothetical protein